MKQRNDDINMTNEMMINRIATQFITEFLGTALLLAIVTGSGVMGETLGAGNAAVALLGAIAVEPVAVRVPGSNVASAVWLVVTLSLVAAVAPAAWAGGSQLNILIGGA